MSIYEEVEIEDMTYDDGLQVYSYPCPCGDKFSISLEELLDGEDVANCPSCTLRIRVIFDEDSLPELREENDDSTCEDETPSVPIEKPSTTCEDKSEEVSDFLQSNQYN